MKHDIEHLLKNMEIPEPDERARETTIKAAVHEFNRKKCDLQENTKGINNERRLTVVLQIFSSLFGGRIMKRPFVFAGGLTAFLAVIGFCLSCYIFLEKR